MALFRATKNLVFQSLDKAVIVDEVVELDPEYAKEVNNNLKLTFPDVPAVLVLVEDENQVEEPKKATRKKKAGADTK
ncbi:TPA: hypothetical protein ACGOY6_001338 [Streptococcus suis]